MSAKIDAGDHIVDVLIAERAPRLRASPVWPLVRPLLYALLGYKAARAYADAIAPMGGRETMDYASALLDLDVRVIGADHIPAAGRAMIVVNHPTGLADGVAVYDAFKSVRPDLLFFANSDAHRINPRLAEIFIPVEWVAGKRTRERTRLTLLRAHEAFEAERAIVIFAAGAMATPDRSGRLVDPPWHPTAVSLARKHGAPVVPVHLAGPPSTLFNVFHRFSAELRDITLFHELLNKAGKRFDLIVGAPVAPQRLEGDAGEITLALKAYIEQVLPEHPDQPFTP